MPTRECRPMPADGLLPPPAPLPSLGDALARRAAVFGPVDLDEVTLAPCGSWQAMRVLVHRIVVVLLDRRDGR